MNMSVEQALAIFERKQALASDGRYSGRPGSASVATEIKVDKITAGLCGIAANAIKEQVENREKDLVPVVRCKDCIHYCPGDGTCEAMGFLDSQDLWREPEVEPDEFCSRGEKREEQ